MYIDMGQERAEKLVRPEKQLLDGKIELVVDDSSTAHVSAVQSELQQVLLNFVVNAEQAIRESKRLPGRITVRSFDRDGRAVLEVEDPEPVVGAVDPLMSDQPLDRKSTRLNSSH